MSESSYDPLAFDQLMAFNDHEQTVLNQAMFTLSEKLLLADYVSTASNETIRQAKLKLLRTVGKENISVRLPQ